MKYQFRAAYVYRKDEPYNNGRGLSFVTDDLNHARETLGAFNQRAAKGETYAVEISDDAGIVIDSSGPSMTAAEASMRRAIQLTAESR